MTVHHPQFLRIWDPATDSTQFAVQNFYQQATISEGGDDYQYLDFSVEGLASTGSADQAEVAITMPAITLAVAVAEEALAGGFLARLRVCRFEADTAPNSPPGGQTTLLELVGEVAGGGSKFDSTLTLAIGSALEALGAQVPPRKFTSALVGVPCRL